MMLGVGGLLAVCLQRRRLHLETPKSCMLAWKMSREGMMKGKL